MPPHVPRKRLRDPSPPGNRSSSKKRAAATVKSSPHGRRKRTLHDDLDASTVNSFETSRSILQNLVESDDDDGFDDEDSSLTSLSDGDFQDVPISKGKPAVESDEEDDEDIVFEDVATHVPQTLVPVPSGDLELTLTKDTRIDLSNPFGTKKGPSKSERQARTATHCVHVQLLLWHNATRNSWLCDQEVQAIMMSHLPPRLWDEVDRWRRNSGLERPPPPQGKGKAPDKGKRIAGRQSRDWASAAEKLEEGAIDMSHGDPLFRLMKSLVAWWRQRFRVTAPGLRKRGYVSLERMSRIIKAYRNEAHDHDRFGERIRSLDEFRLHAQSCTGSRDVGAQLFTALLRALGLEARMVANLQPLGFGWNKLEDAEPEAENEFGKIESPTATGIGEKVAVVSSGSQSAKKAKGKAPATASKQARAGRGKRRAEVLDTDESEELKTDGSDSDDWSIVEVQFTPQKNADRKKYDTDLEFPHYWTEVLSPVTQKYLSVDPIVKNVIATNRELVESLEPRGSKSEKARQVMAYVVGFSKDGTAKDVTVRYLKRQMLPGKTKGLRMPVEKVPIYNRHGKVKRYEKFDWFQSAIRGYLRGSWKAPVTEVDELEGSTDLKPAKIEKKEVKEGEETLQYFKTSTEYVLERHLKREEALLPNAAPVRVFRSKGKGGKVEEENVYLRSDVVQVKSAETWHKQGRAPLPGEQPLKSVPYRAATLNRRREIAEAEAATGQKVLQGLYSFEQTDWIIPPPIRNGIIPKNEYGNIDLFVEHMCPEGAVHVPFRGAVRVCKRLQVDYAEAVVDFEFGHRMAVPVIQGVVIAVEYHDKVMEELRKDEAERARKEDEKRQAAALQNWRKFLMGLRIAERIRQDYGHMDESVEVFGHRRAGGPAGEPDPPPLRDQDMAGGFLPAGFEEEEDETEEHDLMSRRRSGFFAVAHDDEEDGDDALQVEDHRVERQERGGVPQARVGAGGDLVMKDLEQDREGVAGEAMEEEVVAALPSRQSGRPRRQAATNANRRLRAAQSASDSDADSDADEAA